MTYGKVTAQDTGMLTELRIVYLQENLGEIEDAKAENVSNMEFLFIVVWAGVVLCEPIAYLESQLCDGSFSACVCRCVYFVWCKGRYNILYCTGRVRCCVYDDNDFFTIGTGAFCRALIRASKNKLFHGGSGCIFFI